MPPRCFEDSVSSYPLLSILIALLSYLCIHNRIVSPSRIHVHIYILRKHIRIPSTPTTLVPPFSNPWVVLSPVACFLIYYLFDCSAVLLNFGSMHLYNCAMRSSSHYWVYIHITHLLKVHRCGGKWPQNMIHSQSASQHEMLQRRSSSISSSSNSPSA